MQIAFSVLVLVHALIHLLGFARAFSLAEIGRLTQPVSKARGVLWLLAAVLFVISLSLLWLEVDFWWMTAIAAVFLSQVMIFQVWTDAKFGSIANLLILLPLIVAAMNALPSSYQNRYRSEVQKRLSRTAGTPVLTETDIQGLPMAVQKYLHYTGAVGKPMVRNFRAVFQGSMKQTMDGEWLGVDARQYSFVGEPARLFYIESSMFGIPFDGLHIYVVDRATMEIKVAAMVQVVDARGDTMTRSETVTLFNDMCILAPATLIDRQITWEEVDSLTVRARFTNRGNSIGATLSFNGKGELVNFLSTDRYLSRDGKEYSRYPWSTPVQWYKESNGRRLPVYAEAAWHTPEGEFTYARFTIVELEYNTGEFR